MPPCPAGPRRACSCSSTLGAKCLGEAGLEVGGGGGRNPLLAVRRAGVPACPAGRCGAQRCCAAVLPCPAPVQPSDWMQPPRCEM